MQQRIQRLKELAQRNEVKACLSATLIMTVIYLTTSAALVTLPLIILTSLIAAAQVGMAYGLYQGVRHWLKKPMEAPSLRASCTKVISPLPPKRAIENKESVVILKSTPSPKRTPPATPHLPRRRSLRKK